MKQMNLNSSGEASSEAVVTKAATESFVKMLLTGDILQKLKDDFPDAQVQDADDYMDYVHLQYNTHPGNTFALYGIYQLEIVCVGLLSMESMLLREFRHLNLNDYLGFRCVNRRTELIEDIKTYEDLVHQFSEG